MVATSRWGVTPREHVRAECERRGRGAVLDDILALLSGDTDPERARSLANLVSVEKFLDGREHEDVYWFRVWALRGLLWAWDERAESRVVDALGDDSWRVREMAAKVVARHLLGTALQPVALLRDDPVPRVRSAADRALIRLTDASV